MLLSTFAGEGVRRPHCMTSSERRYYLPWTHNEPLKDTARLLPIELWTYSLLCVGVTGGTLEPSKRGAEGLNKWDVWL